MSAAGAASASPKRLRVLLASTHDRTGGAAVAASRLRDGLIAQHHDARLFVQLPSQPQPTTIGPAGGFERTVARFRSDIDGLALRRYAVSPGLFSASWLPRRWPTLSQGGPRDVVHLHWTNGGFLSIADIGNISEPVVWTLHDMWSFTGGCQYDGGCGRYEVGCGRCPVLGSETLKDLSYRRFRTKLQRWENTRLTIVAPSHWMAGEAARSLLFRNRRIEVIRNGIDLGRYQPLEKSFARAALKLPLDHRLILCGALNLGSDRRKGYDLLDTALGRLSASTSGLVPISLVVFGSDPPREELLHGMRVFHFGHLRDDVSLALVYAACDLFVAPSRQENLANTVAEALACGVPCVAFDIGGMPDLIKHRINGFLAAPFDTAALAHGIAWCLETDDARWQGLCTEARRFAVEHIDSSRQTQRHVELYRDVIDSFAEQP